MKYIIDKNKRPSDEGCDILCDVAGRPRVFACAKIPSPCGDMMHLLRSNNDNVIYLNTFSKTISPSLRIGYMVLPKHLVKTYEEKLGFYSCTVPTFMQYVLTELIDNGDFERHINRVRRDLRKQNK